MSQDNFSDATLIVFGHGSTQNDRSGDAVLLQAGELRRRNLFKDVREAFWKQEPDLKDVLTSTSALRVFLAPFFISGGYFSEELIPAHLGFRVTRETAFNRVLRRGDQLLFYCSAVGTHASMSSVVLDRASGIVARFPFPRAPRPSDTTLFIAGHGTERSRNSRAAIDQQVERIRAQNLYAAVHAVFMDEDPRISECFGLSATKNLVVVPFFVGDGMHVQEDIPVLLGEPERLVRQRLEKGAPTWRNPTERNGKLVWYSSSVGTDPLLAEVILERVREAGKGFDDKSLI